MEEHVGGPRWMEVAVFVLVAVAEGLCLVASGSSQLAVAVCDCWLSGGWLFASLPSQPRSPIPRCRIMRCRFLRCSLVFRDGATGR